MMNTLIKKWDEGEGNIVINYEGVGDEIVSISSDVPNEGIDREQEILIQTSNKERSESILVKQIGLREVFSTKDGSFILKDGGTFNVLKAKASVLDKLSNDVLITNSTLLDNGVSKILTMLNNNTYI